MIPQISNPIPTPTTGIMDAMYIIYALLSIVFYTLILWTLHDIYNELKEINQK